MKKRFYKSLLVIGLVVSASWHGWGQADREAANPNENAVTNAQARASGRGGVFQFPGGNFSEFVTKLGEVFGKDVVELIEVRGEGTDRLRMPKMRIQNARDVRNVLFTYNRLSNEGDGFLGKWIFSPPMSGPENAPVDTIMFLPPKAGGADGTGGLQVRAFSVRRMLEERLKALQSTISEEADRLRRDIRSRAGDYSSAEGRVSIHKGTGLLVASGGKAYVELVATLIEAFMTNQEKTVAAEKFPVEESTRSQQTQPPQANPKLPDRR